MYGRVRTRRMRCGSCGHAHAILPDHIVPYSTYGLLFILRVLGEYFLGLRTVEQLCRRYAISASLLYQWKALFPEHKAVWLGVLRDLEITPAEFIRRLLALPRYSCDFGKPFWRKAARSFLQGRREAAAIAQFRFAMIAPVIQGLCPDASRAAYYERVTEKPLTLPDGSTARYSPNALSSWASMYQRIQRALFSADCFRD